MNADRKSAAVAAAGCIVFLLLLLALRGGEPAKIAPVAVAPESLLAVPPLAPVAGEESAPPVKPEKASPHTNAGWAQRLAREDEILVDQAVAAGCDAARATKLRALLGANEAHRAKTIAALEKGEITEKAMRESARAKKLELDAAMKELLRPAELDALDPAEARAQVLAEEKKR